LTISKEEFKGMILVRELSKLDFFDYQEAFLLDCFDPKIRRVVGLFSRQIGKTTGMAVFAVSFALINPNVNVLIIAPVDRQAGELFNRLKAFLNSSQYSDMIVNDTLREIKLTNGSQIRAMPTGDFGNAIRGQTADLLILEESSYIKDQIFSQVIMPMLAATDGKLIQIGTPFLKNHFYEAVNSAEYSVHKYDYTFCPLISKEFIEEQKRILTSLEFRTEYMAEFVEESDQYFSLDLLQSCVVDDLAQWEGV